MVQGHRRESSETKIHFAGPDARLVSRDDGFGESCGTTRVDNGYREQVFGVGTERWIPVCLFWVCNASVGSEYIGRGLVNDRH